MTTELTHIGKYIGRERPFRTNDPDRGGVMTKHGWFSRQDLDEASARVVTDRNGERVIQFPYAIAANGQPMYRDVPDHVVDQHEHELERNRRRTLGMEQEGAG